MTHLKKTPLDLLDDIYSLAYWMTGNEKATADLVNMTYVNLNANAKETEVLKTFRACYVDQYGNEAQLCISEQDCRPHVTLLEKFREWSADIKLSVLMSEISGLKHEQIAEIVGKPVDTIRNWLFIGRRILVRDMRLKATA
ncbi:MAG: RNA polymerase subunit sigma-24 [Chlorobium sp.]|nr:RNA polymerase subunit sigma-24 [Chlorobium phaeovibrioides]NQU45524.1 RNA polymerase subunit sigma-24 [Chlorobium sp.]